MSETGGLRQAWEEQYSGWDDAYRVPPDRIRRWVRKPPANWLAEWAGLHPGYRVLEAGCGGGGHGLALALAGCEVTLLDYAESVLDSARRNLTDLEQRVGQRLPVTLLGDDLTAPAHGPLEGFDLVYNIGVIEHIRDVTERTAFVRAMARCARNGGFVAVAIPNNVHPWAKRWRRAGFPWLQEDHRLCEAAISQAQLEETLREAGLGSIRIDGYAVHETLLKWPKRKWLELAVRGAARVFEPRFGYATRLRWGTWWLAMGRKPLS